MGCGAVFGLKLERNVARFVFTHLKTQVLKCFGTGRYFYFLSCSTFPIAALGLHNVKHLLAFVHACSIGIIDHLYLNTTTAVWFPLAYTAIFERVDKAFGTSCKAVALDNMKVDYDPHIIFFSPCNSRMKLSKMICILGSVSIEQLTFVNGNANMVILKVGQHLNVFLSKQNVCLL